MSYFLLLFGVCALCSCNAGNHSYCFSWTLLISIFIDFTIYPVRDLVILPSEGSLSSTVVLSCNIAPPDYLHTTFWITPSGLEVNMTTTNEHYNMQQGIISQRMMSTTLQINRLSHSDAGNYCCVVNSSNALQPGSSTIQAKATVELRLLGNTLT